MRHRRSIRLVAAAVAVAALVASLIIVLVATPAGAAPPARGPASHLIQDDTAVETVYKRQQFADVWLPSGRSGGTAYVIHPAGVPVPQV